MFSPETCKSARGIVRRSPGVVSAGPPASRTSRGVVPEAGSGLGFPFLSAAAKLRWHSRGVTPLMRLRCIDPGKSVTAKLNSAHPRPSHCPRAAGTTGQEGERGKGGKGEKAAASGASEGNDAGRR